MVLTKEEHERVDRAMATLFDLQRKIPEEILEVILSILGRELQNR